MYYIQGFEKTLKRMLNAVWNIWIHDFHSHVVPYFMQHKENVNVNDICIQHVRQYAW